MISKEIITIKTQEDTYVKANNIGRYASVISSLN